ncbi:interstitial collagenase-like isoform X2 [Mya arenaria]|uniref:interstitial collagenase-like isoform X2 n=1 Tax=Mya arenaria TaxID=6604 RepID=UPI0022DEFEF4|nr:interstitial collagenase-like isoform X2 [Mya arenaria]
MMVNDTWISAFAWFCFCYAYLVKAVPTRGEISSNLITKYNPKYYLQAEKQMKEEKKYLKRRRKLKLRWEFDVDAFLEQYGYLKTLPNEIAPTEIQVHSKVDRKHAIRLYQEYFGIKATGRLNKKTVKVMREPRCAIPDQRTDDPYSPIRQFRFYKYYPRWRRSILTWRAGKYTKKISPLVLWKTIKKAFETWSAVSGLRFLYTRDTPDIQIDFEQGDHGDGADIAFDEQGGKVVHAFGPGTYTISGNIHLDDDEDWTLKVNPKTGVNLLSVVIHSLGHSLGLLHSNDPRSVMYPAFVSTNLDLSQNDIEQVQILYGPNPESKAIPMYMREATTIAPKVCIVPMDDIDQGPDGYAYIFRKGYMLQIDQKGKLVRKPSKKVNITEVYKNGPPKVDAVAYWAERRKTYLFFNNTLWRYTNFDLDYGFPKNITGMPQTPSAGAVIRDQYGITRLLLFAGDQFWEWSTATDRVKKGYPLSTSAYFEGLPTSPTAALRWRDGYVYFFKKDKVYKVHPGSYKVVQGYPRPMPPDWMKDIC